MEIRNDLTWEAVAREHAGAFGFAWVDGATVPAIVAVHRGPDTMHTLLLVRASTSIVGHSQQLLRVASARVDVAPGSMAPLIGNMPPPGVLILDGEHLYVLARWGEGLALCNLKSGELCEEQHPRSGVYFADWSIVSPSAIGDRPDVLYTSRDDGRASS